MEIMDTEQKREKRLKTNEESLRELWDNLNTPTSVLWVPEGEEREKDTEKIFQEIIAKKSLTWERNHSLKSRKHNEYRVK